MTLSCGWIGGFPYLQSNIHFAGLVMNLSIRRIIEPFVGLSKLMIYDLLTDSCLIIS